PRIIIGNDAQLTTVLTRQDWKRDDGKGWGDKGHWLLTVDHTALFDITIEIAEPRPGWYVTLQAGNISRQGTMPDSTKLTFPDIRLEKGDLQLTAMVSTKDKIYPRMHVFITRK
ncbi:MAG: hypothetical protein GWP10_16290, partial [Nitrospiraceae bacterium]|nr:hypothetical protein [Nitrospiraceae bacterium]